MSEFIKREGDYLVYRMRIYDVYKPDPSYQYYYIYSPVTTTGGY
jgi:hypothetical protein